MGARRAGGGRRLRRRARSRSTAARARSQSRRATASASASASSTLLGGLAHQAKLAITNASRFESLEQTFLSTVEALANALEANDEYTSSHARWITDLAMRVGGELGLDARASEARRARRLFHDIGKIGIPSSILLKPGPLTDEERSSSRRHPELGERILAPIDQLEDAAADRPGLPRALGRRRATPTGQGGEAIPIEARIIFACDAFHAMTTDRPYREALPVEEALRRLRRRPGPSSTRASSRRACACSGAKGAPRCGRCQTVSHCSRLVGARRPGALRRRRATRSAGG